MLQQLAVRVVQSWLPLGWAWELLVRYDRSWHRPLVLPQAEDEVVPEQRRRQASIQ